MAVVNVLVPDYAEGAKSIKIREWYVEPNDTVSEGQEIAEAGTDKISIFIEAPVSGRIVELLAEPGDRVAVGQIIATIETE
ncbi:MAG: lipoyl domain-containing protein [Christensenellales bacterium]|jgi:pyruvate/2-oxoglutarate dehydrogenase complex dihydrolipoamide acyltransferase (E2) component